ncbi:MAG: thrombospondin type 3 repeat-containing protein [Gemmatimonadota bacterium]
MRNRFLLAARTLAAFVPTLAMAQQRPAARPAQRPAARPMMAAAHREGSIELSFGGGVMAVDRQLNGYLVNLGVADSSPSRIMPGGAVRLGYNFSKSIGLSVGSGFGTGSGATAISPFGALTWTTDINRKMAPFVTVGAGLTRFSGNSTRLTATYGGHAGLGIRSMVGEKLAVRVEGRMAYESYADVPTTGQDYTAYNGVGSLGVSYFMGGGPPRDTDADGVPDKRDRCAGTARGATVDVRGCTSDTDRDGIVNGLDRCPNTPANTPVDANGCTRDTDTDGIADNLDRCPNTPSDARPLDANGCPADADRDGVADYQDRCASTAAGTPVDAAGCPRDSDGDGVLDNADRCPSSPAGTPVDANGCPRDTDGDGVTDNLDRCANTAAGTQVDTTGCPVQRDADGDGVIDTNDRCANTARTARVDANGCPLAELPAAGATMILRNINFAVAGARLTPSSTATLDGVAAAIIATPGSRWEIGGYTSAVGTAALNQRLSQARAQSVMDYLIRKGVARDQLTAVGYGPQRPVAPNTTPAGRAQNRRVEIKRL